MFHKNLSKQIRIMQYNQEISEELNRIGMEKDAEGFPKSMEILRYRKLYKFKTFNEESIENFKNNTIWVTAPSSFKDPYDTYIFSNTESSQNNIQNFIKKNLSIKNDLNIKSSDWKKILKCNYLYEIEGLKIKKKEELVEFIKNSLHEILASQSNSLRMHCFSDNNTETIMWNHYSDWHKGFCVEYDAKKIALKFLNHFYPVFYHYIPYITQYGSDYKKKFLHNLYKGLYWAYEGEWRFILHLKKDPDTYIRLPKEVKTLEGIDIKVKEKTFKKGGIVEGFKPSAIYLGSKISPQGEQSPNEQELRSIANKKNIPVYKMKISQRSFGMEIEE